MSFMRLIHRRKVLFPQPLGPMSAVTRSCGMSSDTSWSARWLPYQAWNPRACTQMDVAASAFGAVAVAGRGRGNRAGGRGQVHEAELLCRRMRR